MRSGFAVPLFLLSLRAAAAQELDSEPSWRLSGYVLNLLTRSTTVFPAGDRYVLDLNRLRLKVAGRPLDAARIDLQYDNEVLLGSYVHTRQFALSANRVSPTSLDLERTYATGPNVAGRHRLYRATLTWSGGENNITVGRQRIAWGSGRFWSPLDILNPFDAARVEREEREGIDAVLLDRDIGALGNVSGVVAPRTAGSRAVLAGYVHWNANGTDYSALVGTVRGEDVIGADFSGQIGGLGIRGEATSTQPDSGRRFMRLLLGADYGFANTLTVTGEVYFNGQGSSRRTSYDFTGLFEGRIRNVARRYGAIALSYEITQLVRLLAYGLVNLDDGSRLVWPGVEYSLVRNVDLAAGMQSFSGSLGSEYGRLPDVLHFQGKWFF